MSEFDEQVTVNQIGDVLRQRNDEKTPDDIRNRAKVMAQRREIPLDEAYEAMEKLLLDRRIPVGKWW